MGDEIDDYEDEPSIYLTPRERVVAQDELNRHLALVLKTLSAPHAKISLVSEPDC